MVTRVSKTSPVNMEVRLLVLNIILTYNHNYRDLEMDDGCLKHLTESHLKILFSTRWQTEMTEECWFCMKIVWEFTTLRGKMVL